MIYLKKIEEHILDNIDSEDKSLLKKITSIEPDDLIPGNIYNHKKNIKIDNNETKELKTLQKFLKKQNNFFIFKIVKIYTPEISNKIGIKTGDIIKVKKKDIKSYYI